LKAQDGHACHPGLQAQRNLMAHRLAVKAFFGVEKGVKDGMDAAPHQ